MAPCNKLQREIADCLDEALRLQSRVMDENDETVFSAGTHTLTAKLRFADFSSLVRPRIASVSQPIV